MRFLYNENSVYSPKCFLYQYNDNLFKLVKIKACRSSGFEEIKKSLTNSNSYGNNEDELHNSSLSRTRRRIFEIAMCNKFDYFVTLTINNNHIRNDLERVQYDLRKLLKAYKRKTPDFIYLIITELHKDNENYHFHGLFGGINEKDIYINKNGFLSCSFFDTLGFNSFSKIRNYERCCSYITKYITKECVKNSHNQIYIVSRGMKKPTRFVVQNFNNLTFSYKNDYCEIQNFNLQKLTTKDKKNLTILTDNNIYGG